MEVLERARSLASCAPRAVGRRILRRHGFTADAAAGWLDTVAGDWRWNGPERAVELVRAHRSGRSLAAFRQESAGESADRIAERDYYARQPFNRKQPWLRSRVIADRQVPGISAHTPTMYCTLARSRDGLLGAVLVGEERA